MEQTIWKSKFASIIFDAAQSCLKHVWNNLSFTMSEREYKNEIKHFADAMEERNPSNVLYDMDQCGYIGIPDLHVWMGDIFPNASTKTGLQKVAFVYSNDFVPQLALEHTQEEKRSLEIQVKLFEKTSEAEHWLEF